MKIYEKMNGLKSKALIVFLSLGLFAFGSVSLSLAETKITATSAEDIPCPPIPLYDYCPEPTCQYRTVTWLVEGCYYWGQVCDSWTNYGSCEPGTTKSFFDLKPNTEYTVFIQYLRSSNSYTDWYYAYEEIFFKTEKLCVDSDNDGYYAYDISACPTGNDCDDSDSSIYPGATEKCDGKDNNCNKSIDEGLSSDRDGDGHYTPNSCKTPNDDCNDNDSTIYPGASERCDGKDNDCNYNVDDLPPQTCYTGPSGCAGLGICTTGLQTCENGNWSACMGEVTPQEEVCNDGLDNNCNGEVDENCGECSVPPLTPLTDPLAVRMEAGEEVIYEGLTSTMLQAVACFQSAAINAGGALTINSAYRPLQYQQHLREIWDRNDDLESISDPACDLRRSEIAAELQKHMLRARPANVSNHSSGVAIDATLSPATLNVNNIAGGCGLYRPYSWDPVHFELGR